jgi:hypothetical protein
MSCCIEALAGRLHQHAPVLRDVLVASFHGAPPELTLFHAASGGPESRR